MEENNVEKMRIEVKFETLMAILQSQQQHKRHTWYAMI